MAKYGLGELAKYLDVKVKKKSLDNKGLGERLPARIRQALEELGPVYVKFGQLASMRPDLLPPSYIREFNKLQEDVTPLPFDQIRKKLEKEYGRALLEVFEEFNEKPIASASLSQVYKAKLKENEEIVAVKVKRPNIERVIDADIRILKKIAAYLDSKSELRVYRFPQLVEELNMYLQRELDFKTEAVNMSIVRKNFHDFNDIRAPYVHDSFTTRDVLTMEFIEGVGIDEFQGSSQHGKYIAELAIQAVQKQVFIDGFFHADPHGGNVKITPDNELVFLDWGMVGRLTQRMRKYVIKLAWAVLKKDEERIVNLLLEISGSDNYDAIPRLERDILSRLDLLFTQKGKVGYFGSLMLDIFDILRKYNISVPSEYAFMSKSLLLAEGMAYKLDPNLVVVDVLNKVTEKHPMETSVDPKAVAMGLNDVLDIAKKLPTKANRLFHKIESGKVKVEIEHLYLEKLSDSFQKSTNRLTLAVIIGSMIIGSSWIISARIGPYILGQSALGVVGFLASAVLGIKVILDVMGK